MADAALTAGSLPSPVHLLGEPAHQRVLGSLYAALVHAQREETGLRALLAGHPLADSQSVGAVDGRV